jgi:hypothetical protein
MIRNALRLLALVTATAGIAAVAMPATASASTGPLSWTAPILIDGPSPPELIAVSCPASNLCVAIDANGNILTSGSPAGGAGAWQKISGLTISPNENSLETIPLYDDLSCPSVHLCVTAEGGQLLVSTNPRGGAAAWVPVNGIEGGNAAFINAVSCPSVHLCEALDVHPPDATALNSYTTVIASTNPTGGPAAWETVVDKLPSSSAEYTSGLSCASVKLCVAGGDNGSVISTTNAIAGPWHRSGSVEDAMLDVSCPSAKLCVSNDYKHHIDFSTNPAKGHWHTTFRFSLYMACPSASLCVGAGGPGLGVVYSTHPTGGPSAWGEVWFRGLGKPEFNSVSCASTSFCVAVGQRGIVVVGTRAAPAHKKHHKGKKH